MSQFLKPIRIHHYIRPRAATIAFRTQKTRIFWTAHHEPKAIQRGPTQSTLQKLLWIQQESPRINPAHFDHPEYSVWVWPRTEAKSKGRTFIESKGISDIFDIEPNDKTHFFQLWLRKQRWEATEQIWKTHKEVPSEPLGRDTISLWVLWRNPKQV